MYQTESQKILEPELKRCTDMFGEIQEDVRLRLIAVYNNPCQETWDDAYSVLINGKTTLWQAVIAVKSGFIKSAPMNDDCTAKWSMIPSQRTILNAIRYATH